MGGGGCMTTTACKTTLGGACSATWTAGQAVGTSGRPGVGAGASPRLHVSPGSGTGG